MASELKKYLGGGYLGIIHRLDQPVEGLLAFARTPKAAAALSRQLAEGILHKRYCALVCGRPEKECGQLVDYLRREGSMSKVVPEGTQGAQKAVLQYRVRPAGEGNAARGSHNSDKAHSGTAHDMAVHCVVACGAAAPPNYTCLDIHIDTGRFHQIRCQLSHAGMPILGDRKYGTEESLEESGRLGISHTALCACEIRLRHPATGREIFREIAPAWMNRE